MCWLGRPHCRNRSAYRFFWHLLTFVPYCYLIIMPVKLFARCVSVAVFGAILGLGMPRAAHAQSDTLWVQTFTYGSPQDSVFALPPKGEYRKLLMYYNLKCNPAQRPACGEWDYLTYTYLWLPRGGQDSSKKPIDSFFADGRWNYKYPPHFERFELSRYITPYGNGLSLGEKGTTWIFDLTDYLPLMHDSVRLSAGNWQELLNMRLAYVRGTPAREPLRVTNLWNGYIRYDDDTPDLLPEKKIKAGSDAASAALLVRATGHGMGGNLNCAEFCPRWHRLAMNNTEIWKKVIWRGDCALNPVYPQGGTWVYSRSNWCPGAEVATYSVELDIKALQSKQASLEYEMQPYSWDRNGSEPYYMLETQLIEYGPARWKNDVSIESILSPSTADMWARRNPVCFRPTIVIRNTGTDTLRTCEVRYGVAGGEESYFRYKGALPFMAVDTISLDGVNWHGSVEVPRFYATVGTPNGQTDEYAGNNTAYSYIPAAPLLERDIVIQVRTNKNGHETSYYVTDVDGNYIVKRENLASNTLYRDTMRLAGGCYHFQLNDAGQDGLSFWANPDQGTGTVRFYTLGNKLIKNWGGDFGESISFDFMAGYTMNANGDMKAPDPKLNAFPNPVTGALHVDCINMGQGMPVSIRLANMAGKELYHVEHAANTQPYYTIDTRAFAPGLYILQVRCGAQWRTLKVQVQ